MQSSTDLRKQRATAVGEGQTLKVICITYLRYFMEPSELRGGCAPLLSSPLLFSNQISAATTISAPWKLSKVSFNTTARTN
jgi:hypothetical protein